MLQFIKNKQKKTQCLLILSVTSEHSLHLSPLMSPSDLRTILCQILTFYCIPEMSSMAFSSVVQRSELNVIRQVYTDFL